jgi:hypothetical protein
MHCPGIWNCCTQHDGPQTIWATMHSIPYTDRQQAHPLVVCHSTPAALWHTQAKGMAVAQGSTGKHVAIGCSKVVVEDGPSFVRLAAVAGKHTTHRQFAPDK